MPVSSMDKLLSPRSVAIVGASREPTKLGHIVFSNIVTGGYAGKIFLVNPHADVIDGHVCYPAYGAIPEVPDVAIIALPAEHVLDVVSEIAAVGTKNIVILSAGFKEAGEEGEKRERDLVDLAQKFDLHIIGPNCLGFINNACKLNATFGQTGHKPGSIRFILQSGALATSLFDWAESTGLGFDSCITLGNKTVVGENEILSYWLEQQKKFPSKVTAYRPIGLYLESVENGKKLLALARAIGRTNPLFVLLPGRSPAARAAMQSHTGSMASDEAVLSVALSESGVIRCEGIEDFFDLTKAFSWAQAPKSPSVAIVSNAGGPAVLSTDSLAREGLELAKISRKTQSILYAALPRAANIHDPIDVLGDALADRYRVALEAVLLEREVQSAVVLLTPQVMTQIEATVEVIRIMAEKFRKPIFCSFMGGDVVEKGIKLLNSYHIPCFRFPERAIKALGAMWHWEVWRQKNQNEKIPAAISYISKIKLLRAQKIIAHYSAAGTQSMPAVEAQRLFSVSGIATPREAVVKSFSEAIQFATKNHFPVVLKISSAHMLHKTEEHGVITRITNEVALKAAYTRLSKKLSTLSDPQATIQIQKQVLDGVEVLVGFKRDPSFGPVLLFGAGGILTELVQDKNLHIFPLSVVSLKNVIQKSRVGKLLGGYRGHKPFATDSLIKLILQMAQLFESFPEISEMETNPAIVTQKGSYAIDAKILFKLHLK